MVVILVFESDVISDGTQTPRVDQIPPSSFESDVISDGTQTMAVMLQVVQKFESDVISDGTQTTVPATTKQT